MKKVMLFITIIIIQTCISVGQTTFENSPEKLKALIQLSKSFLEKEGATAAMLDSAMLYAKQAETLLQSLNNDPNTGEVYLLLTQVCEAYGNLEEGIVFGKKAVAYFSKHGPKVKLAESYIALGKNYEPYGTGFTERLRLCEAAIEIFHAEGRKKEEADATKELAFILMNNGEWPKSLEALQKSLVIYQSINYKEVQEVYSLIGVIYDQTGNYSEALNYGLKAVRTAEALNDSSQKAAEIYNYLALTYSRLGEHAKAEEFIRKAFAITEKGKDVSFLLQLAANIAQLLSVQHKPAEGLQFLQGVIKKYPPQDPPSELQIATRLLSLSLELKDFNNAAEYCRQLIEASEKFPAESPVQTVAYQLIVRYYILTHQYTNVRKYLEPYRKIAEDTRTMQDIKNAHLFWFQLDSAEGNYNSAIEHLVLFKLYSDSIYSQNRIREISELQVKYETEKKEKDIQLLTEQSILQKTQLKQAALIRNVTFGGVALMLIILALLYNRYRLKQRTNIKLEAQQTVINQKNDSLQNLVHEKEWLLKEIHHRVKNNLHTVMSLLNSQSAYIQNDAALIAIQDSKHRVHAMSLIHQKLYSTENVSTIDMPVYIRELIEYMKSCFNTGQRIRFDLNIESLELDVSQAVPLGLILNEAITNSLKYAFPDNREGIINIILKHTLNDNYLLTISDNGIGMPPDFNEKKTGSLGLSLIKGLSEDLDGTFTLESNGGTTIKILFVHDVTIKRKSTFASAEAISI